MWAAVELQYVITRNRHPHPATTKNSIESHISVVVVASSSQQATENRTENSSRIRGSCPTTTIASRRVPDSDRMRIEGFISKKGIEMKKEIRQHYYSNLREKILEKRDS